MNKIIMLLSGMPATGKSTIAKEFLFATKDLNIKIGYISGDVVAHLVFDCQYTQEELDIKYANMINIINNLLPYCDVIFIEDLFKRQKDWDKITKECSLKSKLYTYSLVCNYQLLLERNRHRAKEQKLPDSKMYEYHNNYSEYNTLGDVQINTQLKSVADIGLFLKDCLINHLENAKKS